MPCTKLGENIANSIVGFAQKISVAPVTSPTAANPSPSPTAVNGGPNPLSDSKSSSVPLFSSNTIFITGSMSSMEPSNRTPTDAGTATPKAATPTPTTTSNSGAASPLHETSGSGTVAAETTSPSASPAPSKSSATTRHDTGLYYNAALAVAALITLIS